jgi:organic hydroperoxide reductase OsmC/OhrA
MTDTVHTYRAVAHWSGSTVGGYNSYDRAHSVQCPPVDTSLQMTSDPAFVGDPSLLNPEQLLLAAASSCQLLTFLAVAARAHVDVVEYHDEAEALMPEDDKPVRITKVILRPRITVDGAVTEERIRHLVDVAHQACFIANSLRSEFSIEPSIRIR